jgi:hypothetical protein
MFFLYHRTSAPTGRVLAEALGVPHGLTPPTQPDAVVRWGNRAPLPWRAGVVNEATALTLAADKLRSMEVMREAGVRVPNFSTDPTELNYPFLGRRRSHVRGTDIVLCLQRGDWRRKPRDYYVEYVPTVREYRVHVFDGQVIRVQGKYLDIPEDAAPHIRNHAHGYRFRSPAKRLRSERIEQATLAVSCLGLDFGAVDLLVGEDGNGYVLEVNTAPSCSPRTGAAYVNAIAAQFNITDVRLDELEILSAAQEEQDTEDEVLEQEEQDAPEGSEDTRDDGRQAEEGLALVGEGHPEG